MFEEEDKIYIDGTGHVLGRLSSWIAKELMNGEEIVVLNSEKLIVSGRRGQILEDRLQKRERATHTNPNKGPFYPRFPDRILRRTVRGMLPWKKKMGRQAFRRLSAYIGVPDEYERTNLISIDDAKRSPSHGYISVGEIARNIGWQNKVNN